MKKNLIFPTIMVVLWVLTLLVGFVWSLYEGIKI